jgi:hypothetical protein
MYKNSTGGARRSCSTNPTNKALKVEQEGGLANQPRHRIAALWRAGMNPKGRGVAARGERGR